MSRLPMWAAVVAVSAGLLLAFLVVDIGAPEEAKEEGCREVPHLTGQPATSGFAPGTVLFGATVPTSPVGPDVEATATAAGKAPGAVQIFRDWYSPFPSEFARDTASEAIPMITWQPWTSTEKLDSSLTLDSLSEGKHDDYIRTWAQAAAASCRPLLLRFAPEMNGPWVGWSESSNGNQPGDFVAAWRHVHGLVAESGATNIAWVWNPNVLASGIPHFEPLYPGDAYVDWLGLTGFNWGTAGFRSTWSSFGRVFDQSLAAIADISDKPVMLGEIASTEDGGDKAEWIADMFAQIPERSQVRGLIWFDIDKETDWRIHSSGASQRAFRAGIDADTYLGEGQVPASLVVPSG